MPIIEPDVMVAEFPAIPVPSFSKQEERLPPGTPVDIFIPANQPKGERVWVTGYKISESKKPKHKRMFFAVGTSPHTGQLEACYAVQSGARVFPVIRSFVRISGVSTSDLWEPNALVSSVVLEGYIVSDESDKADLEAIDSLVPPESPEED